HRQRDRRGPRDRGRGVRVHAPDDGRLDHVREHRDEPDGLLRVVPGRGERVQPPGGQRVHPDRGCDLTSSAGAGGRGYRTSSKDSTVPLTFAWPVTLPPG